ncbi:hypothetical protein [Salinisphaera sp. T31B1]|uniref:hypothetical protein n=1 Tax=Salinisphaera sp. T31B1 TaxID=727963 RepID=UPI0033418786
MLGTFLGNQLAPAATRADGLILYHWIVVGAVFSAVVALVYVPFLYRLPARTRWLMIASGAIYVSGALFVEDGNGVIAHAYSYPSLAYQLGTVIEKCMEMAGVALFAHTLSTHLVQRIGGMDLVCGPVQSLRFEHDSACTRLPSTGSAAAAGTGDS